MELKTNLQQFWLNKNFFSCMVKEFLSNKINHKNCKYILNQKSNIIIFSGYPGYIIKNKLLLSKKIYIHILVSFKLQRKYYNLLFIIKEGKFFALLLSLILNDLVKIYWQKIIKFQEIFLNRWWIWRKN